MSYFESAEELQITEQRALKELKNHGIPESEYALFYDEVKPKDNGMYNAQDVLSWLGY